METGFWETKFKVAHQTFGNLKHNLCRTTRQGYESSRQTKENIGNAYDAVILQVSEPDRQLMLTTAVATIAVVSFFTIKKPRFVLTNIAFVYAGGSLALRLEENLNPF